MLFIIIVILGRVIEIDESKLFHAKYNKGSMLGRQYDWVFDMLERGTNKVRFFHVVNGTANTLLPIIAANVEPGSTIASDGWAAYGGLNSLQFSTNICFAVFTIITKFFNILEEMRIQFPV